MESEHPFDQGALDSLHRFFDYALSRGGPKHQSLPGTLTSSGASARGVIQYAILNLAALHFRFGHLNLAAAAIDEAVRVAQAGRDHACVTFALSWLHHISDARHADGDEVLQRCVSRARELGLAHLAASTQRESDKEAQGREWPRTVLSRK